MTVDKLSMTEESMLGLLPSQKDIGAEPATIAVKLGIQKLVNMI
jgi:hypothetical protein